MCIRDSAEAVAHVADLQTQIAIAQAAAEDASDPESQAAAKQLLITLEQALIEAESAVEATAEAVTEAKAIVVETYVTAAEPDASSEAAEAMNAWEAAAAELAAADAFVEEVKAALEEAHRSGDAEAIKSLTLQLEAAIEAQATAKVAEEDAKELVDENTAGVTAAERAAEVAEAEAAVDEAKEQLLEAKAAVSDIAAKIAEAQTAGDVELVARLEEQLKIKQAAVVAAEEAVEAAEKAVVSIQTSHAADIAQSIADEYRATSDEFDQKEHEETMAKLDAVVEDAADAVEVAKKNMDDLQARIEAIVLAAADPSDPAAQKAAQAQLEALEKKLAAAKATFAAAVAHHDDVKESRDAYETKALAHKAATADAKDTAETIARAIEEKIAAERARGPGAAPGMAPGMAPGPAGMATHYVKVTDADGTTRYVALETVMHEAQTAVDDLKSQLLKLLEQERAAAESGDADAYAKMKAKVAILKKELAEAESALEDAVKLVASHGYGPAAAPGMSPASAPSYPDKFIKITDPDGTTRYVSAQAAADQALHAYQDATDKVDELKQDLLALLAQMKAAADAGDEQAYNALKEKVASAKSKLRVAEIQAEDALAVYNDAAAQAPGAMPLAPTPSAHDSILASDVAHAKTEVQEIKTELLDLLAQMKRAADSKDKVAYDALKKKVGELKTKLALSERRLADAEDRLNGVYHEEAVQPGPKKKVVKAPPAPRYQGPPATVSVDARHIKWYDAPKGAVTGMIFSEKKGTHVEYGEIVNVEPYDVVASDGVYLREGDIKLPAMRDMADEAVSVSVRLKFCLLYTSPSPRDRQKSRMPSSA